ncbi:MAG: 2-amino-4-hydroxy-6-hydroxymethyldihydropteridine diphosphokinase [Planctomycetota bacterium]
MFAESHGSPNDDQSAGECVRYLLLLGSNIEREQNLAHAHTTLSERYTVLACSRICDSEAVGAPQTPRFFNQAVWIETQRSPDTLRSELRAIEAQLGRQRSDDRNAPREIDIDILLATTHDGTIDEATPIDPELLTAHHVCVPAADIAGTTYLPQHGRTIGEIAAALAPPPAGFEIVGTMDGG